MNEPLNDDLALVDLRSTHLAAGGLTARRLFLRRVALFLGSSALFPRLSAFASAPEFYEVKPGDTLSEIADKYGIRLSQLRSLNGIKTDLIRPGQKLRLRVAPSYPLIQSVRSRIDVPNLDRKRWRHIIMHHSATAGGNAAMFDRYHRQHRHMENGLAYHFLIGNGTDSPDGAVEVGGRWTRQLQGGHVRSFAYNEDSIGICLVGDFERTRPTSRQIATSLELVSYLQNELLKGRTRLLVHREIHGEHTLCPGKNFPLTRFRRFRA